MINSTEKKCLRYFSPLLRRRYIALKRKVGLVGEEYGLRPFEVHRCIFVHIPKTGGVSIAKALFGNLAAGHCTVSDHRFFFGDDAYDSMFTFAFVRNPYDRLVSAYDFLRQGGMTKRDRKWSEKNLTQYGSVNEFVEAWIRTENVDSWVHFRRQADFVKGKHPIDVDFIGKTENIKKDFKKVSAKIGHYKELPHLNKSGKNKYFERLNKKSKKIINKKYKKDFELFSYKKQNLK